MRASDVIFDILKQYVDTVFFVSGGQAAFLVDSLGRSGLRYVACLHEQGAGFAALGYAMQRGGLGVCLVTSGPGATNALTPCAAAWMDSVPVLFISGQARSDSLIGDTGLRTRGIQEVDIISMVRPVTKRAYQLVFANHIISGDIRDDIWELANLCLEGRPGPCWIDIPLDQQSEELEDE